MMRSGLTLLEVLLATAILSALAATGAVLLRDAAAAERAARESSSARMAYDRWWVEHDSKDPDGWLWRDVLGARWSVRTVPVVVDEPAPTEESTPDERLRVEPRAHVVARTVPGEPHREVLRVLSLAEPAEETTP